MGLRRAESPFRQGFDRAPKPEPKVSQSLCYLVRVRADQVTLSDLWRAIQSRLAAGATNPVQFAARHWSFGTVQAA